MNGFYGLKQLTGNVPADPPAFETGRIAHPDPRAEPTRLVQLAKGPRVPVTPVEHAGRALH
jgi:hypothetical protein